MKIISKLLNTPSGGVRKGPRPGPGPKIDAGLQPGSGPCAKFWARARTRGPSAHRRKDYCATLRVCPFGFHFFLQRKLSFTSGSQQNHVSGTKQVQTNHLGLIFGVPGSNRRCTSFSSRLKLWVCEDLVAVRTPPFLHIKNELSQDKFR